MTSADTPDGSAAPSAVSLSPQDREFLAESVRAEVEAAITGAERQKDRRTTLLASVVGLLSAILGAVVASLTAYGGFENELELQAADLNNKLEVQRRDFENKLHLQSREILASKILGPGDSVQVTAGNLLLAYETGLIDLKPEAVARLRKARNEDPGLQVPLLQASWVDERGVLQYVRTPKLGDDDTDWVQRHAQSVRERSEEHPPVKS